MTLGGVILKLAQVPTECSSPSLRTFSALALLAAISKIAIMRSMVPLAKWGPLLCFCYCSALSVTAAATACLSAVC